MAILGVSFAQGGWLSPLLSAFGAHLLHLSPPCLRTARPVNPGPEVGSSLHVPGQPPVLSRMLLRARAPFEGSEKAKLCLRPFTTLDLPLASNAEEIPCLFCLCR